MVDLKKHFKFKREDLPLGLGILAAIILMMLAAVGHCEAQFIGYVSPQTVNTTLASATACTGGAQTFTTGVTANFSNIGQTQHLLTIALTAGSPTLFRAVINGIDRNGNVFPISDAMRLAQGQANASLFAHGWYPQIQISIQCSVGTSFTASYSGSSSDSGPIIGASQAGQLAKSIAATIPMNTSFTDNTFQTPFGNSQGFLYVIPNGVPPAGSSVSLTCQGLGPQTYTLDTFPMPVFNSLFFYTLPNASCPFISVTYTSGGASAGSLQIELDFVQPGSGNQGAFYSPAQLAVSALTEPGAGTSALSTIVDTRNAKEATLDFSCTAGAISVNVQLYNDDGTTTASIVTPLTAVAAATKTQLYIGSEANTSSSGGTISATAIVRLPQRAMAFSFTNAGGAGTCTARLYLSY